MTARKHPSSRGFTLLEVMIALALLGFALVVLIKSAAGDIFNAQQAHMMGVVTDLARGKVYDIEEKLLHDGFSDTEQHEDDKPFTDEGWPAVHYSYKIEVVELPSFESLQKIAAGQGSGSSAGSGHGALGSGSGLGSDADFANLGSGGFQNSALGGMLAQFGGFGFGSGGGKSGGGIPGMGSGSGSDIASQGGMAFIQTEYTMFQQILKVSIRKLTLTLKWKVLGSDREMSVVSFFTDAGAMDQVLQGMGSQDLGSGSGSGSSKPGGGSGSSAGSGTTTGSRH
jgi:general secretion pathway protein I